MDREQMIEVAKEAGLEVAYLHNEMWAKTNGSPTDKAVEQIVRAALAALEAAGVVMVPSDNARAKLYADAANVYEQALDRLARTNELLARAEAAYNTAMLAARPK